MQKLSELRSSPVVGKFYLVPVVRDYPYLGRRDTWPVIGPMHDDKEHFNFRDMHYHVDARFLTSAQVSFFLRRSSDNKTIESVTGRYPLFSWGNEHQKGAPVLARRKCRAASYGYVFGEKEAVLALNKAYPDAQAITRKNGRLLCPHRKADLSSFSPDADGYVVCPLHGLKVKCQ